MEDVQSLLTAVNTLIATDRHTFMAEASLEERREPLRKELLKPQHMRRKV